MAETLITSEMRQWIGRRSEPFSFEIEKGDVVRFARATKSANARFTDELAARDGAYGGIIASPTYSIVMRTLQARVLADLREQIRCKVNLDGGSEWTYVEPLRPGDTITGTTWLADIYERVGRVGLMLFEITETDYTNQFGRLVLKQRDTSIWYG